MINISDDYGMMKTWRISNYGGPSKIVRDIINNLSKRSKPAPDNRKEKFSFYLAITAAIHRLELLSRVTHINGAELSPVYYPEVCSAV